MSDGRGSPATGSAAAGQGGSMDRLRDLPPSDDAVVTEMARLVRSARAPEPSVRVERRILARVREAPRARGLTGLRMVVAIGVVAATSAVAAAWVVTAVVEHHAAKPAPPAPELAPTTPSIVRIAPRVSTGDRARRDDDASAVIGPIDRVAIANAPAPGPLGFAASEAPVPVPLAPPVPVPLAPPVPVPLAPPVPVPPPRATAPREIVRAVAPARPAAMPARVIADEPAGEVAPVPALAPAPPLPVASVPRAALVASARVALAEDPRRALALVERYLRENARGALVEEALAVSIEAQLALGDATGASAAARDYLRDYPTGQFAELARRARP